MEKRDSKYLYGLTIVLAVAVVGLSIAYAALSTTLNAQFGTVTQSSATWNVGFIGNSATAIESGTSDTGRSCSTATISPASVTIDNTTLSKPGDGCAYALTIANTGDINAKLSEISYTKPDSGCTTSGASMVCGNITYKLATNDTGTTLLATNSTIQAKTGQQQLWLFITYTGADVSATQVNLSNAKFTLVYSQN